MRVQWTIVVTAAVGDEGEAAQQLRGLLKVALRRFGMRCTTVSETRLVPSPLLREGAVRREAARRERVRRVVARAGTKGGWVGTTGSLFEPT